MSICTNKVDLTNVFTIHHPQIYVYKMYTFRSLSLNVAFS